MPWVPEFVICASRGFGERKLYPRLGHARLTYSHEEPRLVTYVCRDYDEFTLLNQEAVKKNLNGNQLWCAVRYRNTVTGEIRKPAKGDQVAFVSEQVTEAGASCEGLPAEETAKTDETDETPPPVALSGSSPMPPAPAGPPPLPEPVSPKIIGNPPFQKAHSAPQKRQHHRSTGRVGGGAVKGGGAPPKPKATKKPAALPV